MNKESRLFSDASRAIELNGSPHHSPARTVADLIVELDLPPGKVAVERNREIVPKSRYAEIALAEGDRIEIVHFVGGG